MASVIFIQVLEPLPALVAPVVADLYSAGVLVTSITATDIDSGKHFSADLAGQVANLDPGYTVVWRDGDGNEYGHPCIEYWDGTNTIDPNSQLVQMIEADGADWRFDANALEEGEDDFDVN